MSKACMALAGCGLLWAQAALAVPSFTDLYLIGDSLTDQGNLFQATQSLQGLGIPASDHYFNGRFAEGENYAGFLAQRLGLSLALSSSGGNNFAYGGARTSYNIVEVPVAAGGGGLPVGAFPWSLNRERQAFEARGVNDPGALFVVFSGSNDMSDLIRPTLLGGFDSTRPQTEAAVQGIVDVVNAYKAAGAHHVLVPNVPDLGLVPRVRAGNPPGSTAVSNLATALATRYNSLLQAALAQIQDVEIIEFDTFGLLREVVANPASFGFGNVTQPCYTGFVSPALPTDTVCADPASYVYWDSEHPTSAMHALLAGRMLAAVSSAVPVAGSLWLLFACLAALGLSARYNSRVRVASRRSPSPAAPSR